MGRDVGTWGGGRGGDMGRCCASGQGHRCGMVFVE